MADMKSEILAHHAFAFSHLSPGEGSNEQPYIRFLMFIKKRADISDQRFHEWWKTVHADLAVSVAGFGGHCKRYVQLHQTPEHRAELEKYSMKPLPYDGIGEMYVKSLDDWVKFQSSPAFSKKLIHDGANFMDGTLKVMMGYDNLIFGNKIEHSDGNDGILTDDQRLTPALKDSKL
ncbi:EthD domain-containing protein [Pyrenochaeta sp. MPI-SDFR-AT-0127]|nr:EthD domain-containing protein [Pyrenochaeta sp. MPI-SDFR-AT-0127]